MENEVHKVIPFKRSEKMSKEDRRTLSLEEVLKQVIDKNSEVKRRLAKKRNEDNQNVLEAYRLKD